MAICGSRSESIETVASSGSSTGLIAYINTGVASQESHRQVPNGNKSTAVIGRALNAAGTRTATRKMSYAPNDQVDEAAP